MTAGTIADPARWRAMARLVNEADMLAGRWNKPVSKLTWSKR